MKKRLTLEDKGSFERRRESQRSQKYFDRIDFTVLRIPNLPVTPTTPPTQVRQSLSLNTLKGAKASAFAVRTLQDVPKRPSALLSTSIDYSSIGTKAKSTQEHLSADRPSTFLFTGINHPPIPTKTESPQRQLSTDRSLPLLPTIIDNPWIHVGVKPPGVILSKETESIQALINPFSSPPSGQSSESSKPLVQERSSGKIKVKVQSTVTVAPDDPVSLFFLIFCATTPQVRLYYQNCELDPNLSFAYQGLSTNAKSEPSQFSNYIAKLQETQCLCK